LLHNVGEIIKMKGKEIPSFNPDIPPDLEHSSLIREEALDWLETRYPGTRSFTTSQVLRMGGEPDRRWLIARLRDREIGNEVEFSLIDTANALTVLFLRSNGVKFHDAVEAVVREKADQTSSEPKYGGMWNRLIITALDRLRRRISPRLISAALFSLIRDRHELANGLVIVKRYFKSEAAFPAKCSHVSHDYVYQTVLQRPAPACAVIAPSGEILLLPKEQLPARSELISRQFVSIRLKTDLENYELLLGTLKTVSIAPDNAITQFVGQILDMVFIHFEAFLLTQSSLRLETPIEPESTSAEDLQLWLTTQFLTRLYPGSLCEISETSLLSHETRVLASSITRPWEPAPWGPAKSLEMLSGYASQTAAPLVIEKLEYPYTMIVEGVESELRYLKSKGSNNQPVPEYSSLALPITSSSGNFAGALYLLMPRLKKSHLDLEIRVLTVFSRIIGEMIERRRAAAYSSEVTDNVVNQNMLNRAQFKAALLDLLGVKAAELNKKEYGRRDVRLPFILLSAHSAESKELDPTVLGYLRNWLAETLHFLEWRSFIRHHWSGSGDSLSSEGFIGEISGIGVMIGLGRLVSKDELDQIRNAFPSTINRTSPTNSPVKLVAWVLDVTAERIQAADAEKKLLILADEIEDWAFKVATVVDDLAQSFVLAYSEGEWDAALKRIRQALQKPGASQNSYLRRMAADCSLALGDWPGALKYAQEAVSLSGQELGSGLVRSLCIAADAHLCLGQPVRAWDLYSEAARKSPNHPLPRYYRGQALLLMARLLKVYGDECRRSGQVKTDSNKKIDVVIGSLANGAIEDLTLAADLLERWGLMPESYHYRNFHLIPTLLGQSLSYLLSHSPGPAASRLQSARHSFPKDDQFLREFLFAKCWEQGVHRVYAELLLTDGWDPLRERLNREYNNARD
jgi:hypothetical protein